MAMQRSVPFTPPADLEAQKSNFLHQSPVYTTLVNDHIPPSAEQVSAVKEIVADPLKELQGIDEQLQALLVRREILQHFVEEHSRLISPMRRVPVEILSKIFLHSVLDDVDELPTPSVTDAPLSLTGVCRLWRQVALSEQGLWNSIKMTIPYFDPDNHSSFLSKEAMRVRGIRSWLLRAGALPLRISLTLNSERVDLAHPEKEAFSRRLRICVEFSSRWQSLTFGGYDEVDLGFITSANAPLLEEFYPLELYWAQNENRGATSLLQMLKNTHIHVLDIQQFHINLDMLLQSSPEMSRLTDFHIAVASGLTELRYPASFVHHLATMCPSLLRCDIRFPDGVIDRGDGNRTLPVAQRWPSLQVLSIRMEDLFGQDQESQVIRGMADIFGVITAPVLKDLTLLSSNMPDDPSEHLPFHNFLLQSNCIASLTRLKISIRAASTGSQLLRTLAVLPSLSSLILVHKATSVNDLNYSYHGSDDLAEARYFLRSFTSGNKERDVCPSLETLRLDFWYPNVLPEIFALGLVLAGKTRMKFLAVNFGEQSPHVGEFLYSARRVVERKEELEGKGVFVKWIYSEVVDLAEET